MVESETKYTRTAFQTTLLLLLMRIVWCNKISDDDDNNNNNNNNSSNMSTDTLLNNSLRLWDNSTEVRAQLISDETTRVVMQVLMYAVTPIVSILGICGNVLSIMILIRHGMQKCSNILLVYLAVTDMSFLIGFNNVPRMLYDLQGQGRFLYSETVSRFLYVVYFLFLYMDYGIGLISLTIPMLITLERMVAVYIPLKFSRIITPGRTWVALAGVSAYWMIYIAYTCFWFRFAYVHDEDLGRRVGVMERTELFYRDQKNMEVLEEVYFSIKIPPIFTLIGCVFIIVKVKLASAKRQKMSSSSSTAASSTKRSGVSKTTKTLLSVCFFYIIACIAISLPSYLPKEFMSYSLTTDTPSNLGSITYQVANIIGLVNSSCNFVIYIALNKNFHDTYHDIIGNCCKRKGKEGGQS